MSRVGPTRSTFGFLVAGTLAGWLFSAWWFGEASSTADAWPRLFGSLIGLGIGLLVEHIFLGKAHLTNTLIFLAIVVIFAMLFLPPRSSYRPGVFRSNVSSSCVCSRSTTPPTHNKALHPAAATLCHLVRLNGGG